MEFREILKLSNDEVILKLEANELSFRNFIDAMKYYTQLSRRLESDGQLFQKLYAKRLLLHDDVDYLLTAIDNPFEVQQLLQNQFLLKHIYENFLLNDEHLEKLNFYIKNSFCILTKDSHNRDFFDFVELYSTYSFGVRSVLYKKDAQDVDHELLSLNNMYRFVYTQLNNEEKTKLIDAIKSNIVALFRLKHIFENHLESTFEDFDDLLKYVSKMEKKTTLNI